MNRRVLKSFRQNSRVSSLQLSFGSLEALLAIACMIFIIYVPLQLTNISLTKDHWGFGLVLGVLPSFMRPMSSRVHEQALLLTIFVEKAQERIQLDRRYN